MHLSFQNLATITAFICFTLTIVWLLAKVDPSVKTRIYLV